MPTVQEVKEIFRPLILGDGHGFCKHVMYDAEWILKGTYCLLPEHYKHADTTPFVAVRDGTLHLHVQNIICDGRQAAVELRALNLTCKANRPFSNEYVWICEFNDENKIVKIKAYMDSDLVTRSIRGNQ